MAEAPGAHEAKEGIPLVGDAGYYLWSNLQRVGIKREGFRVHNVLSCRPPDNKLSKMPYEEAAIEHCSPLLDATIADMREVCHRSGRTCVILTLGKIAFQRVMGYTRHEPILKEDYHNYPFWSDRYRAWVIAADHPSFLMRGNHNLLPVLQFAFRRALEIAEAGLVLDEPTYDLTLSPPEFERWANDYLRVADYPDCYLSYDIETNYKGGKKEDTLQEIEGDQITRCAFAYRRGMACSVPWSGDYLPTIRRILMDPGKKFGWNSDRFDNRKIRADGVALDGIVLDAMVLWHVLNTSLPKALGFVTPFYVQNTSMWKHLSHEHPEFYNAKDADMACHCLHGIIQNLKEAGQWSVVERHILQPAQVFSYMSQQGVPLDHQLRQEAETTLSKELHDIDTRIVEAVPDDLKKEQVFKRFPQTFEGVLSRSSGLPELVCASCGFLRPPKNHFAKTKKRANPCYGSGTVEIAGVEYYRPIDWKISHQSLSAYQAHQGQRPIAVFDRATKDTKVSYDEDAIVRLMERYPKDLLYPSILDHRELQKLLSTYIGVTKYQQMDVDDNYVLQPGERWVDAI